MIAHITADFKKQVCDEVELAPKGIDRYAVRMPFTFADGDHFVILLSFKDGHWLLTDEGHTFMHMSYSGIDFSEGQRRRIIDEAIKYHGIEDNEGVLSIVVPDGDFGGALYSFIHAISKISNVTRISREFVRTTFYEDLKNLLQATIPDDKLAEKWHDKENDPRGLYVADYRVEGIHRPWLVFGVHSNAKCQSATIACLKFEDYQQNAGTLAVFENQSGINRTALAQLTDVVGKQFSSLDDKARIESYIRREIIDV